MNQEDLNPTAEEQMSPALGWLLYKITREFSSSLDLDKVLSRVLIFTVQVFGASVGSIFLLDSRGRITKSILARQDLSPEVKEQTVDAVMEKGFGGWVYRHAKADIISDTRRDSRWISLPDDSLVTLSAVSAPLIRRGHVTGIITLHHPEPDHFNREQLDLMQAIAGEAAMAVENASLYKKVMEEHVMLKRLDELKNEFVAHVAHDLKSPLSVIYSYAELLQRFNGLDTEGQEFLKEIHTAVDRMRSLIGNVLDINRIEMGIESELGPVDVAEVLNCSAGTLQGLARDRGVSLSISVSEKLPLVNGAPIRLGQVFSNLAGNAIKFTPSGGSVSINGSYEGDRVIVRVVDSGPGIPENLMPKLFQKFSKLGQAETRKYEGHGLGLAIAKSIIDAHKGDLWVESVPGAGSTFSFSLPLAAQ
ncbi:MAG: GAF domain-containing protein [Nitrospirae bacterium]|nr:GAF domain-containing protein [Nitrospirota bacterium]